MFFELKSPLSPVLKMKYEIFFYGYRFNWEIISIIHLRRGESKIFSGTLGEGGIRYFSENYGECEVFENIGQGTSDSLIL